MPAVRLEEEVSAPDSAYHHGCRDLMLWVLCTCEEGLKVVGEVQVEQRALSQRKLRR